MTTYRVLAEADACHRRRQVASLVTGSPEGPRMDPPRTVRCVIGGLLVAAVCVAGTVAGDAACGHPEISGEPHGIRVSP
ncbi:MAG TPA: hypothetical protein VH228_05165 [Nocardioides sp.]|nr:hypothetical protein [Nocardioides sp.]